jgi:uncharacterized coiled-coil DUF342 family protein
MNIEEKTKEYENISSEINSLISRVLELNKKIKDIEKVAEEYKKEETKLINKIKELKENRIEIGVPVPRFGGFEILKGLPDMKRDINLKLVFYLGDDDKKIRQVFYLFIYLFNYNLIFFSYLL